MNPGEFRHKTVLSVKSTTQISNYGDFEETSSVEHTKFARLKWLPGTEEVNSEIVQLTKNAEFTYRYSSVTEILNRIDTITYNNEVFLIKSIEFRGHANQQTVVIKGETVI
tara:strand:- start:9135 stop:9467 length:333 start_codon:yes stop_codon:yes gene_type:complete